MDESMDQWANGAARQASSRVAKRNNKNKNNNKNNNINTLTTQHNATQRNTTQRSTTQHNATQHTRRALLLASIQSGKHAGIKDRMRGEARRGDSSQCCNAIIHCASQYDSKYFVLWSPHHPS